jgi:hypothetical protein
MTPPAGEIDGTMADDSDVTDHRSISMMRA